MSPPPSAHWLGRWFKRDARTPVERTITPPLVAPTPTPAAVAAAVGDVPDDTAGPLPALTMLAQRLGLSDFERDVLLLCAAMELDTRTALLCAQAQHDAGKPYPTFALAMALFDQPAWDAMSPERPLRYWRLVEISASAAQPLVGSLLRADERIVSYLKGANYLDERIAPLVVALAEPAFELPPSQQSLADAIVDRLQTAEVGAARSCSCSAATRRASSWSPRASAERLGLRAIVSPPRRSGDAGRAGNPVARVAT